MGHAGCSTLLDDGGRLDAGREVAGPDVAPASAPPPLAPDDDDDDDVLLLPGVPVLEVGQAANRPRHITLIRNRRAMVFLWKARE